MVVTDSKARCHARSKVVHDDIGGLDHLVKDSLAFRIFRSNTTPSLFLFTPRKARDSLSRVDGYLRKVSPPGGSILMTSAPRSPSRAHPYGPRDVSAQIQDGDSWLSGPFEEPPIVSATSCDSCSGSTVVATFSIPVFPVVSLLVYEWRRWLAML